MTDQESNPERDASIITPGVPEDHRSFRGGSARLRMQTARLSLGDWIRRAGVLVPLVLIWIYLAVDVDVFLTTYNINNLLLQGAVIGVLAFGTTFALLTEQIDLSIGAVAGTSAVGAAYVMVNYGWPWYMGVIAGIGVGFLFGVVNGIFSTAFGIPSFITTLATLGIASGISYNLSGGESIYNFPEQFQDIGQGHILGMRSPIVVALVVLVVLQFVLKRTRLGMSFYGVGDNASAAGLAGIPTMRIKAYAMIISGTCAGIAGVLLAAQLNTANPTFGAATLLPAIAAVVIGGTALTGGVGSVVGTALGVLVIVTLQNGLDLKGINPFWKEPVIGAVILLVAMFDRRRR